MQKVWDELYSQLEKEISECQHKGLPLLEEGEQCFHISSKYLSVLKHRTARYRFNSIEEEILYYKHYKPKFLSWIEYFSLIVHSLTFCPDELFPLQVLDFWKRQNKRLQRFTQNHKELFNYYKSNLTNSDAMYFSKEANDPERITDDFENTTPEPSKAIGKLLGLEMYHVFAANQLAISNARQERIKQ